MWRAKDTAQHCRAHRQVTTNLAVMKALLDNGADVNAKSSRSSALRRVSWHRRWAAKLLSGCNGTALEKASKMGHAVVVSLLLDNGATADVEGRYEYGTALQAAS